MSRSIQIVVIGDHFFLGGGDAERSNIDKEFNVMALNKSSQIWSVLPSYRARWFAMAVVEGRLTLVGGQDIEHNDVGLLGVWDEGEWNYSVYPPMSKCQFHSSVVTYKTRVIVAGGTTNNRDTLSTIEILDLTSKQWHQLNDAPIPFYSMKSVVIGCKWYLMGGFHGQDVTREVFAINLEDIVSNNDSESTWQTLPELNTYYSAPLVWHDQLVAVGGWTTVYQSESQCIFA